MPKGLNTEINPRALGDGQYPEFTNVTHSTGGITPRLGDTTIASSSLDYRTKSIITLGTMEYAFCYNEADKSTPIVFSYDVGSVYPKLFAPESGAIDFLIYDKPNEPTLVSFVKSSVTQPDTIQFAMTAESPTIVDGVTPLSDVFKINLKEYQAVAISVTAGENPPLVNTTITNTSISKSGNIVNILGSSLSGTDSYAITSTTSQSGNGDLTGWANGITVSYNDDTATGVVTDLVIGTGFLVNIGVEESANWVYFYPITFNLVITGGGDAPNPVYPIVNPSDKSVTVSAVGSVVSATTDNYTLIVYKQGDTTFWDNAETVEYDNGGVVSGTINGTSDPDLTSYLPIFSSGYTTIYGDMIKWALYQLDPISSKWLRHAQADFFTDDITASQFFPYESDEVTFLPEWPGPVDATGDPVNMVTRDDIKSATEATCLPIEVHKGCLFIAVGDKIYFSEPEQPRYFRENSVVQSISPVLKMVSRDEILEVYTDGAVKYIIGNAPYFEIRETGINEGPISRTVVAKSDIGTFALFEDGLYLCNGASRRNLTAGNNTSWIRDHRAKLTSGTMFSGKGVVYLLDTDGEALCYDWEHDEFYNRSFEIYSDKTAFYVESQKSLVYWKTVDSYASIETSDSAVSWAVKWKQIGSGKLRPTPVRTFIDADTTNGFLLSFYNENDQVDTFAVDGPREYTLPAGRARFYSFRASGSDKSTEMTFRMIEARP